MNPVTHRQNLNAIRRFFDGHAPRWDAMVGKSHGDRLMQLLAGVEFPKAGRILDIGTGTGVLWPILRRYTGDGTRLTAIDVAPVMLAEARLAQGAFSADILVADGQEMPFAEASFAGVFCNSCFPHFEDQARALAEMMRVLIPGGMLLICHSESRAAINHRHHEVGGIVGGHDLPDPDTLVAMAAAAGARVRQAFDTDAGYLFIGTKPAA